jgi:hypothetical protein
VSLTRTKPWERPAPFVPKPQTRRLDDKGPSRNSAWLAHIRSLPCLCCAHGGQRHPTEAHHPKGLFPRTIGKRISDLLALQLCQWHHTLAPDALHRTGDEQRWWRSKGVDPYGVILSNLAGCRDPDKGEAMDFVKLWRERNAG